MTIAKLASDATMLIVVCQALLWLLNAQHNIAGNSVLLIIFSSDLTKCSMTSNITDGKVCKEVSWEADCDSRETHLTAASASQCHSNPVLNMCTHMTIMGAPDWLLVVLCTDTTQSSRELACRSDATLKLYLSTCTDRAAWVHLQHTVVQTVIMSPVLLK